MWPPRLSLRVLRCPPRGLIFLGAARRKIGLPPRSPTACGSLAFKHEWRDHGFTLIELLLVVAIIAIASAGVSFALRDSGQTQLEREAVRLAALLESGRARSQASGVAVLWRPTPRGFVFDGLPAATLPDAWLGDTVSVAEPVQVLLGPEPVIGPQAIRLVAAGQAGRSLTVATDGVRPFAVQ
jgi:general secretion pathway protein H